MLFFFGKILDLIYPPCCGFCGKLNSNSLCDDCKKNISELTCNFTENFQKEDIYFTEFLYIFKYEGIIRDKLLDYKFKEKSYLYNTFEKIIFNDKKICDFINSYDIIIPVPIHKKRRAERGYNQCELIANKLVIDMNNVYNHKIILNKDCLIKKNNIVKQSSLNRKNRINNISNAYSLNLEKIEILKNKKILIFDDIFTTGSTANECAKVLKKSNPKKIGVLTIAKD